MNMEPELHRRETYFIFFDSAHRPTLAQAKKALGQLGSEYQVSNLLADDAGRLESFSLASADDNAALEISFESGDAVIEQTTELAKQLKGEAEPEQLAKLVRADSRYDVMHFEMLRDDFFPGDDDDEDDLDDMLDPSCLLLVVQALVKLTKGIPTDPASGVILP